MTFQIKAVLLLLSIITISSFISFSNLKINPEPPQIMINKISETARLSSLHTWLKQDNPDQSKKTINVGLVSDVFELNNMSLLAYIEILAEEGFPFTVLTLEELASISTDEMTNIFWALIFPEGLKLCNLATVEKRLIEWLEKRGGKILIVFDGIDKEEMEELISLTGLKFSRRNDPRSDIFIGPWIVSPGSPLTKYIDPGLINKGNQIQIPGYPPYNSPHLAIEAASERVKLLASTISPEGKIIPVVTAQVFPGNGGIFFINSPLGSLKAKANDDFLLRTVLKYFLIDEARVPRLIATPGGTGGLVLNLHICAQKSLQFTRKLLDSKAFTPDLPMSICASAGPDDLVKGDHRGVDAAGKGKYLLKNLERYGRLGAHGGWNHAYWGLLFNKIPESEKQQLIDKNISVINQIAAKAVTEYAAPNGRHSPKINDYLARWGVEATVFPAAFNSPPTRTWSNGKPDLRFWHFGYTSTKCGNCPENMLTAGCQPSQIVKAIREEVIDTAINRREIRLFYTHADSLAKHPQIWRELKNYLLEQKKAGRLTIRTMSDYVNFLNRHQAVKFTFRREGNGYELEAISPFSLKELTFALPLKGKECLENTNDDVWSFSQEESWIYATIVKDVHHSKLYVRNASELQ